MKLLVLALSVALLFTAGNALRCHHCIPQGPFESCTPSVEKCSPEKKACIANSFMSEPNISYQECTTLEECRNAQTNTWMDVKCCTTDMCNTF